MCKSARSNQPLSVTAAAAAAQAGQDLAPPHESSPSPRHLVQRPSAPTPEQTTHWLQGLGQQTPERLSSQATGADGSAAAPPAPPARSPAPESPTPDSPADRAMRRPRSPTPTKMLAWEEQSGPGGAARGSPEDRDSDHEGRGDHTDGLISKLLEACQMNNVNKAFAFYEKLRRMRVPLYEGVYKMVIECCMRTQQLGHAMQFYETLRGSGQRVSTRLVSILMEACAKEQHGDKVHALWNDWCPPGQAISASQGEVLLVAVSALIRTMSPDLARDVLSDAIRRSGGSLLAALPDAEVELEELLHLNHSVAEEARMNGTVLEEELAGRFSELHVLLEGLYQQCVQDGGPRGPAHGGRGLGGCASADELLMEDVDLDLELAAM